MPRLTALSAIASNLLSMSTFNFPPPTPPSQTTTPSIEATAAAGSTPQIPVITFTAASQESYTVQRVSEVLRQQPLQANTLRVPPRASPHRTRLQETQETSRGRSQMTKVLSFTVSNLNAHSGCTKSGHTQSSNATGGQGESIAVQVGGSQAVHSEQSNAPASIAMKSGHFDQATLPFNKDLLKQGLFLREIAKARMQREMLRLREQEIRLQRKRVQLEIEELDEKIRLSRRRITRLRRGRLM